MIAVEAMTRLMPAARPTAALIERALKAGTANTLYRERAAETPTITRSQTSQLPM
jgi:tRNA pseudouridine-54 N-methylase